MEQSDIKCLTEPISCKVRSYALGAGCRAGTSLAMAPALLLAGRADFADLDGPLLSRASGSRALFTKTAKFNSSAPSFGDDNFTDSLLGSKASSF
jgi:hypothetical protein